MKNFLCPACRIFQIQERESPESPSWLHKSALYAGYASDSPRILLVRVILERGTGIRSNPLLESRRDTTRDREAHFGILKFSG